MPSRAQKIGTVEEFMADNEDAWVLIEVLEANDFGEPTIGRLLLASDNRDEVYALLGKTKKKDVAIFYAGEIPPGDMGVVL